MSDPIPFDPQRMQMTEEETAVMRKYFSMLGRAGSQTRTPEKAAASRRNAARPNEVYTFLEAGHCRDGQFRIFLERKSDKKRIQATAKRVVQLRAQGRLIEKTV